MNLIRQNQNGDLWDPFQLLGDMDRFFERPVHGENGTSLRSPEIDMEETDTEYIVKADLPGLKKEEIEITVTGNTLTIQGERKGESEKKEKGWTYSERWSGSFLRRLELPAEVDSSKAKASFKDGVLELRVAKAEAAKPKQIKVEVK